MHNLKPISKSKLSQAKKKLQKFWFSMYEKLQNVSFQVCGDFFDRANLFLYYDTPILH